MIDLEVKTEKIKDFLSDFFEFYSSPFAAKINRKLIMGEELTSADMANMGYLKNFLDENQNFTFCTYVEKLIDNNREPIDLVEEIIKIIMETMGCKNRYNPNKNSHEIFIWGEKASNGTFLDRYRRQERTRYRREDRLTPSERYFLKQICNTYDIQYRGILVD